MTNEKFTFFWNGPFSQWANSPFIIRGVNYNCAEQFMMAEKARLFKDEQTFQDIMTTHRPNEQKALGRQVKNFDLTLWQENAKLIVYRGSFAKFVQHKKSYEALVETKGTTLVEASPYDVIWGIGMGEDEPTSKIVITGKARTGWEKS